MTQPTTPEPEPKRCPLEGARDLANKWGKQLEGGDIGGDTIFLGYAILLASLVVYQGLRELKTGKDAKP